MKTFALLNIYKPKIDPQLNNANQFLSFKKQNNPCQSEYR